MTNTYPKDAPIEVKIKEELRCIRCAMERLMRILDEGMFVDYEMEKFGKKVMSGKKEAVDKRIEEMVKKGEKLQIKKLKKVKE